MELKSTPGVDSIPQAWIPIPQAWISLPEAQNRLQRRGLHDRRAHVIGHDISVTTSGVRPLWLPGGKELLYGHNGKLHIVNIETGAIRDVATPQLIYSGRQIEADVWMSEIASGKSKAGG